MKRQTGNIFSKLAKGLNSMGGKNAITVKKTAEILGPVVLANVIDQKVSDVEPIKKVIGLLGFLEQKHQELLDMTVGQIPIFGQIYKSIANMGNFITKQMRDIIMPNMSKNAEEGKTWNDPAIYEHLPKYMQDIEISGNFSTPLNPIRMGSGDTFVPSIVNVYQIPNIYSNANIASQQFSSMYSVIKAARGLSSTIYNWRTVRDYYTGIILLHVINATMEKAINAATATDYTKPEMPDVLIESLGFDPQDLKLHIAEYIDGYNTFRGQVNTLGLIEWGFYPDKINYSKVLLKDANIKSCTYIHMCYPLPERIDYTSEKHIQSIKFYSPIRGTYTRKFSVASIQAIYNLVLSIFTSSNNMEAFKSDAIGCLASTNAIKLEYKSRNLFSTAKYDELALNSLKNADLSINYDGVFKGKIGYEANQYVLTYKDATDNSQLANANIIKSEFFNSSTSEVTSYGNFYPKWDKYAYAHTVSTSFNPYVYNDYVDENVTIPKDKAARGYALELMNKHYARPVGIMKIDTNKNINTYFETGSDAIILITHNTRLTDIEPLFNESYVLSEDEISAQDVTVWGLVDFMPNYIVANTTKVLINLWQLDNIGKVNLTKMRQINDYTLMSLLNLNIKVEGAKSQQIQNLIDLYTK